MLSDEEVELAGSLDRLAADGVASGIAAAEVGLSQQRLSDKPAAATDADAD